MRRLFQLKEWLTVAETASHLSSIFGEPVSEVDILRLALDKHLRLSIYIVNGTTVRYGNLVGIDNVVWGEFPPGAMDMMPGLPQEYKGKPVKYISSLQIDENRYLNLDREVKTIWGVWDIPMIGGEKLDIEHTYQQQIGGPPITAHIMSGAFVEHSDGHICQLMESFDYNEYQKGSKAQLAGLNERIAIGEIKPEEAQAILAQHEADRKIFLQNRRNKPKENDYYPAAGLPHDAVLVVRTKEIIRFQSEVVQRSSEPTVQTADMQAKELSSKERTTLLVLLGLAAHAGDLDLDDLAKTLLKAAEEKGIEIARRTVEDKTRAVRAAMSDRAK